MCMGRCFCFNLLKYPTTNNKIKQRKKIIIALNRFSEKSNNNVYIINDNSGVNYNTIFVLNKKYSININQCNNSI